MTDVAAKRAQDIIDLIATADVVDDTVCARVQDLLDSGADVNMRTVRGHTFLTHLLLHKFDTPFDRRLIDMIIATGRADLNMADDMGMTPIYAAVARKDIAVAQALVEHGAIPAIRDVWNAMDGKAWDIACLLIPHLPENADINWIPANGKMNALTLAVQHAYENAVRLMLDAGADPNAHNKAFGGTALHWAGHDCGDVIINMLLDAGADPNARDDDGDTPLHYASRHFNSFAAAAFLRGGTDPQATDRHGKTAPEVGTRGTRPQDDFGPELRQIIADVMAEKEKLHAENMAALRARGTAIDHDVDKAPQRITVRHKPPAI